MMAAWPQNWASPPFHNASRGTATAIYFSAGM